MVNYIVKLILHRLIWFREASWVCVYMYLSSIIGSKSSYGKNWISYTSRVSREHVSYMLLTRPLWYASTLWYASRTLRYASRRLWYYCRTLRYRLDYDKFLHAFFGVVVRIGVCKWLKTFLEGMEMEMLKKMCLTNEDCHIDCVIQKMMLGIMYYLASIPYW
jgi:hypothetical protein